MKLTLRGAGNSYCVGTDLNAALLQGLEATYFFEQAQVKGGSPSYEDFFEALKIELIGN